MTLDHVAIAVRNLESALHLYRDGFGFTHVRTEDVPSEKVRVAFLETGASRIELMEPLSDDSAVAAFLSKRGEGIHHVAFRTDSLDEDMARLLAQGCTFIPPAPRVREGGHKVAFAHPKSAHGVLIELVDVHGEY